MGILTLGSITDLEADSYNSEKESKREDDKKGIDKNLVWFMCSNYNRKKNTVSNDSIFLLTDQPIVTPIITHASNRLKFA